MLYEIGYNVIGGALVLKFEYDVFEKLKIYTCALCFYCLFCYSYYEETLVIVSYMFSSSSLPFITDPWSAFTAAERSLHSYGRLSVVNKTHLYFEQVMVKDGKILDSIWMVQNHHGQFVKNITCTGSYQSKSCTCPKPYPYVVFGIIGGLGFLLLIASTIVLCCCLRRKGYLKCNNKSKNYRLVSHVDSDDDIIL